MDNELDILADLLLDGMTTLNIATNDEGRFFAWVVRGDEKIESDPDMTTMEDVILSLVSNVKGSGFSV